MVLYDEFGPEKVLTVYNAKAGMYGFVVIDNTALGPGKGGISSYVEYIGGTEEDMFTMVEKKISQNVRQVLDEAVKDNAPPRDIALDMAKARVREKCTICKV